MISAGPTGDTAVSLWGSNWRTPTSSEYSALISNCDWTWCDGTSVQYVAGCKLPGWKVSGRDSYSESHIFLPLSGLRDQSRNYVETLGTRACYWSSNTGYYLNLYTSSKTIYAADNGHGMTVRAVLAE